MTRAALHRPGIAFETRMPAISEALPRLDVAAFVGFARAGPLDTPVAVEDAARFHEIFGTDVPLAWDDVRGDWQWGELAPAVRTFFHNGGRRCWVVRVARRSEAKSNCFSLPGVLALAPDGALGAAAALARAPGSWSDDLEVNAALSLRPLGRATSAAGPLDALVSGARAGDLVRLQYDAAGVIAFLAPVSSPRPGKRTGVPYAADAGSWFERVTPASLQRTAAEEDGIAPVQAPLGVQRTTGAGAVAESALADRAIAIAQLGWRGDRELVVQLDTATAANVGNGAWLRLTMAGAIAPRTPEIWLLVERDEHAEGAGATARLVSESAWWVLDPVAAAASLAGATPQRATVELELTVRASGDSSMRLAGLGCATGHPRFWGDAPTDAVLFALDESGRAIDAGRTVEELGMHASVDRPRFPLAALPSSAGAARLLPLGVMGWPREGLYQPPLPRPESSRTRDGLTSFDDSPFLDRGLATTGTARLTSEATQIQFVLPPDDGRGCAGRRLTGMHALLPIEEVAMIAVPDAVQRGWRGYAVERSAIGAPDLTAAAPAPGGAGVSLRWTAVEGAVSYEAEISTDPRFATRSATRTVDGEIESDHEGEVTLLDSTAAIEDRLPATPGVVCPPEPCGGTTSYYRARAVDAGGVTGPWSNTRGTNPTPRAFSPASRPPLPAPGRPTIGEARGRLLIDWTWSGDAPIGAAVTFTLERATDAAFDSAVAIYRGERTHFELWRSTREVSWFRVTADVDGRHTAWSPSASAGIIRTASVLVDAIPDYSADTLERVHLALLRLCAARGDCHAILGLPLHWREEAASVHVARLAARIASEEGDGRPLSFGALFHPWPVVRDSSENAGRSIWAVAPDGAACGAIATRTLSSGAWYSAANQPLAGVVSLEPRLAEGAADALLAARINALEQQPRGFVALDEQTLSPDPELGTIHVRRLMILLRRLALREGTVLVFQPHDDVLRRQAERLFDRLLGDLYIRGAFAGATPDESYRVSAGEGLNPPPSMEQGRLIVELRVAPSSPMNFLTVRLVQQGGELLVASGER